MSTRHSQQVLNYYMEVYQQLYKKSPANATLLENDWVMVNHARMSIGELEQMTQQLQLEYRKQAARQHGIAKRLVGWLNKH